METEKGEGCEVEKVKNLAVDLVTITKTNYEIDFEREKSFDLCEQDTLENTSAPLDTSSGAKN